MLHSAAITRRVALAAAAVALVGACTSTGPGDALREESSGIDGLESLAGEEQRDTGPPPVALPQVAASPEEDVPSALRERDHPDLPQPLVDLEEIISGGPPPDGIPAIDDPTFQRTGDIQWVDDGEQVLVVEVGTETRAYPIQILTLHEIVNDTLDGIPVAVTYCPLCASGIAFDRRVGDRVLSFGTSGELYRSDLVMYDRQTESLWPQIEGRAVAGVLTGTELEVLPASLLSWEQWRQAHPDGWVLSRETGYERNYGSNPYYKYDDKESLPLFFEGPIDNRVEWLKQPVVGIEVGGDALAVDIEALREDGVREVTVGGRDLTVWWLPGARSSLDEFAVGEGREVGTTVVFDPVVDGRRLTFRASGDAVVDAETGSTWNALGEAVDGELQGARLTAVPYVTTFWFAWSSFHEDTRVER
jgi:hypothetical protein